MGRIDFCAAVATSIIASTIPEPLNAQVAWRQFDVAGVRIGMGCFQAIDELKSQGYIPNPGGEGRIGTEDQLVALALRKPVPSSILHVQETTEFRRSAIESVELRCHLRPGGPEVWYIQYLTSVASISDDNMRQKLVGKYGPPSRDDYYWNKAEEIVWTDEPVPADIMMFAVFAGGGLEYKVDLGEGVRTLTLRETPGVVQQQDREMDAIIRTDVDKSREPPKF
jgi:hypothetical protein